MTTRRAYVPVAACGLFCVATGAGAQPVTYQLNDGSVLTEVHCLSPCLCPLHQLQGPASGGFELRLVGEDPLFRYYSVSVFDATAVLPGVPRHVTGSGTYRIGGEVAVMHQMVLDLSVDGGEVWRYDSGLVAADPAHRFPAIGVHLETEVIVCRQNLLELVASPAPVCYPDCDQTSIPPILSVNDFLCFQARFAAGDPYANCDGSTQTPTLNVNDFICFMQAFAAGCG